MFLLTDIPKQSRQSVRIGAINRLLHSISWRLMHSSLENLNRMMTTLGTIAFYSRRGVSGTCMPRLCPQKVPAKVTALLDCAISPMAIYTTLARWAPSTSVYTSLLTSSDSSPITDSSLAPLFHALSIRKHSSAAQMCVVDTGASMCFCRPTHPCVQPWSICLLDRPLRIQQITTACYCKQFGIALLIVEQAIREMWRF